MDTQTSNSKKLLFIDDDRFLLDMYTKKFIDAGFTVETMRDANDHDETFVDAVFKVQPAMVITNLTMSGRDGLDAIKLLREDQRTKNMPIVVLTNRGMPNDINKAKKLNVQGYIVKATITPADVVKEVEKILKNDTMSSE